MNYFVFCAVVISSFVLVASLVFSIARPTNRIWPAPQPSEPAWRVRLIVHRVAGALVGLTGIGVLGLAVVDRGSLNLPAGPRWLVGAALLSFGAAFGLWGYVQLGPVASQGALVPLQSLGPYRYSRNPQYVGAVGVLLGFALLCNSQLGLLAAVACSVWFIAAPFAEEKWLRQHLGAHYDEYLASVPRFLGLPKRKHRGA